MMQKHISSALCLLLGGVSLAASAGLSTPALAQDNPAFGVKATDAPGLLTILRQAGYDAKLKERAGEDESTSIAIPTRGGDSYILFEDCQESVRDFCETLILTTSWDRTTPISDSAIADANSRFKYVSVWRNEDGDPEMQWAILTRDIGIAPPLFLNALQRYLSIVSDFDDVAFEGDEPDEQPADAAPTN